MGTLVTDRPMGLKKTPQSLFTQAAKAPTPLFERRALFLESEAHGIWSQSVLHCQPLSVRLVRARRVEDNPEMENADAPPVSVQRDQQIPQNPCERRRF